MQGKPNSGHGCIAAEVPPASQGWTEQIRHRGLTRASGFRSNGVVAMHLGSTVADKAGAIRGTCEPTLDLPAIHSELRTDTVGTASKNSGEYEQAV